MYHLLAATLIAVLGYNQQPAPAVSTSCTADHEQARIIQPALLTFPNVAKLTSVTDPAVIQVDLSETGRVLNTSVARSSGSAILDRAALDTVASSTYAPETEACVGVAGSYAVEVDFDD